MMAQQFSKKAIRKMALAFSYKAAALIPIWIRNEYQGDLISQKSQNDFETSYLDGVRGLAAVSVFLYHYSLPYQPGLNYAYGHGNDRSLLQIPFIRLVHSGHVAVALLFVISGFGLALKPIQHGRNKDWARFLETSASSTFRRGPRLFGPVLVSSFVVMFCVYLGGYHFDYQTFMRARVPRRPEQFTSLRAQFVDWIEFVTLELTNPWRWTTVPSTYDTHLWTIPIQYRASLILQVVLTGLAMVKSVARMAVILLLSAYCLWSRRWDICLFLGGALCAEVFLVVRENGPMSGLMSRTGNRARTIATFTLCIGLYLCSFPSHGADTTPGFILMDSLMTWYRSWHAIGSIICIMSLTWLDFLHSVLNTALLQYLGQISFALYITHGPILHLFGYSFVPLMWQFTGNDSTFSYQLGFVLALLPLTLVVMWVADVFWRLVDLPSVRMARKLEQWFCCDKDDVGGKSALPVHISQANTVTQ